MYFMLTDWKLTDQLASISNQDLATHLFCKVQFVIQHLILAKMCYCTISLFSQIYPCQNTSNIRKLSRKQSAEEHRRTANRFNTSSNLALNRSTNQSTNSKNATGWSLGDKNQIESAGFLQKWEPNSTKTSIPWFSISV